MAQSMGTVSVPISDVASRITLRISGLAGFKIRLRVACWLFRLGALVAGVNVVVDD